MRFQFDAVKSPELRLTLLIHCEGLPKLFILLCDYPDGMNAASETVRAVQISSYSKDGFLTNPKPYSRVMCESKIQQRPLAFPV